MSNIILSCINNVKRGSNNKRPDVPTSYVISTFHGDASGSMLQLYDAPKTGARYFLQKQKTFAKKHPDTRCHTIFSTFSESATIAFDGNPANLTNTDIENCVDAMTPTNRTNLFTTSIQAMAKQLKIVQHIKKNIPKAVAKLDPEFSIIFTLLTDGKNNIGTADLPAFRRAVARHKKIGAKFLFLAANQDAFKAGKSYGFDPNACLQMGANEIDANGAFTAMADATIRQTSTASKRFKSSTNAPVFTPMERQRSCGHPYMPASKRVSQIRQSAIYSPTRCKPSIPWGRSPGRYIIKGKNYLPAPRKLRYPPVPLFQNNTPSIGTVAASSGTTPFCLNAPPVLNMAQNSAN